MRRALPLFVALLLAVPALTLAAGGVTVTVSGQAVTADGQPVAGAQVSVGYYAADPHGKPLLCFERLQSDAGGRFSTPLQVLDPQAPLTVVATRPGLTLAAYATSAAQPEPLRLVLRGQPPRCGGVVTDAGGVPLQGVTVSAVINATGQDSVLLAAEQCPTATTDERGAFELAGVPPEPPTYLRFSAEGYARTRQQVELPLKPGQFRVALEKEAVISGRVRCEGRAVGPVPVFGCAGESALAPWGLATSTDSGEFVLRGLSSGTYTLTLAPDCELPGLLARPTTGVSVKAGETRRGVEVLLTPGGLLRGTVREAGTDRPLAGITVYASSPDYPAGTPNVSWSAHSDAGGAYELRVLPGAVRLRCLSEQRPVAPAQRTVTVAEGQVVEGLSFTADAPPQLRGRVLLPGGGAAAGVTVRVAVYGREYEPQPRVETDATGSFALAVRPSAENVPYLLVAEDRDRGLAAAALVEAAAAPPTLQLSPAGYVRAQAQDEQRRAVPQVGICAYTSPPGAHELLLVAEAASDEGGRLELGPLPPGLQLGVGVASRWEDKLLDRDWRYLQEMRLAAGEVRSLPPLRLNLQGRTLSGSVVDQAGQPLPGIAVYGSGAEEAVQSDREGRFTLRGLTAQGRVWVIAMHPAQPLAAAVVVDPEAPAPLRLALAPLAGAEGRLVAATGQPVRGQVLLWPDYPNSTAYNRFQVPAPLAARLAAQREDWAVSSDAEGRWRVTTLLPGLTYRVYCLLPEGQSPKLATFEAVPGVATPLGELRATPQER